jgi:L-fuculose-phosphate aldolase
LKYMINNRYKIQANSLAEYCHRLYNRDLIGPTEGNLSVRLNKKSILITPAGINKEAVTKSEMVNISIEGQILAGVHQPSSEYRLHNEIYKQRPDIKAICHSHPVYATSFAVAGKPLDKVILPEIVAAIGLIPISDYGIPGTADLARKVGKLAKDFNVVLIKNHGVVTLGENLEEAYNRMELTERYARILFSAMAIGNVQQFPSAMARKLPGHERVKKQISVIRANRGKE